MRKRSSTLRVRRREGEGISIKALGLAWAGTLDTDGKGSRVWHAAIVLVVSTNFNNESVNDPNRGQLQVERIELTVDYN